MILKYSFPYVKSIYELMYLQDDICLLFNLKQKKLSKIIKTIYTLH